MLFDVKESLGKSTKELPLLNEPVRIMPSVFASSNRLNTKDLIEWIEKTPEVLGMLRKMSTDAVTDVTFEPVKSQTKGRPGVKQDEKKVDLAKDFYEGQHFRQADKNFTVDFFGSGNGYLWLGLPDDKQLKELVKKHSKGSFLSTKDLHFRLTDFVDEDYNLLNEVRHLAASTVEIVHDNTSILWFKQVVPEAAFSSTFERKYSPEIIIHGKFVDYNGRVHATTPLRAALPVIQTLGLLKDYLGNWFSQGGNPDYAIIMEEENPNSASYRRNQQQWQSFEGNKKRGNLFLTGKVKIEQINEFNKDMEFTKLAVYYTGILANSMGLPASYVKAILGIEVKQSSAGEDATEASYWNGISEVQEYKEHLFNSQLWIPFFGVRMKYKRRYKIDQIKESQNAMFLADTLPKINQMLLSYKKRIRQNRFAKVMEKFPQIDEEDVEDIPKDQLDLMNNMGNPPNNRQGFQDNKSLESGQTTQQNRDKKRESAKKT